MDYFRFKQSVEWDFSDAESVLSDEVRKQPRYLKVTQQSRFILLQLSISDKRRRKESKVEITLPRGAVWDDGATIDGRTLERLYSK